MSTSLRRGLPRTPGGEAWPPEGTTAPPTDFAPSAIGGAPAISADTQAEEKAEPARAAFEAAEPAPAPVASAAPAGAAPAAQTFRRGLPRTEGGEPWPPADAAPEGAAAIVASPAPAQPAPATSAPTETPVEAPAAPAAQKRAPDPTGDAVATAQGDARRGLPREVGAEAWPPAGTVVSNAFAAAPAAAPSTAAPTEPAKPVSEQAAQATPAPSPVRQPLGAPAAPDTEPAPSPAPVAPAPAAPTPVATPAAATTAPSPEPAAKAEPRKYGPFTIKQWVGAGAVIALAIVGAVTLVVLAARWFVNLEFMTSFIAKYPGEYDLPESAPVGFPGWLGWQHFFNFFLMVLIIRSGILVRKQERPEAFWSSKKNPKKINIQLWLHQSLNILWVVNGAIFLVLLFATGQWMRVIPTSPEVFPNAISAMLQYLTLDWPADNGWVNYNSLQQLAYFATIFIAAPLSAITGYRMSESWPRESKLSEKFPVEWARSLHFPLMIYFVGFIVVHVALVFTTGALRNLNHMFAAQGSPDPSVYAANWTGFWWFVLSIAVVAGAWIAARPLVIAPIARIFGNVSAR